MSRPLVYRLAGITPVIDPDAWVHPSAVLIGDVIVGPRCYVAAGAVMRGDFGRIVLEAGANLQDNCVVHSLPDFDTVMEADAHIGHGAVIHGCRIGRDALVGMNAVVMDRAIVGEQAVVAAMSFVRIGGGAGPPPPAARPPAAGGGRGRAGAGRPRRPGPRAATGARRSRGSACAADSGRTFPRERPRTPRPGSLRR